MQSFAYLEVADSKGFVAGKAVLTSSTRDSVDLAGYILPCKRSGRREVLGSLDASGTDGGDTRARLFLSGCVVL